METIVPERYWAWASCALLALICTGLAAISEFPWWPAIVFAALTCIGIWDYTQPHQAIRRNYPIIAHFRFFFELIRPEIRQYFIEADSDETPFSRAQRSVVYQRSKNTLDLRPYGTQLDEYAPQYEWINHSIAPTHIDGHDFRITIGEDHCDQPYSASVFNISAMSFGSLSANAIL